MTGTIAPPKVPDCIAGIEMDLNGLESAGADLRRFVEVHRAFEGLRATYRRNPDALGGCVDDLRRLKARFEELSLRRVEQVVDRFQVLTEQIHRAEEEREFWRQTLIAAAHDERECELRGSAATVRVRASSGRAVPRAGTPQRAELDDLVKRAGAWEQVSQLAATKLQRAIERQGLGSCQRDVERLCPRATKHTLVARPLAAG